MPDLVGSRLGEYLIDERLGGGAHADVYRARQESPGFKRDVAIKVLKDQPNFIARFERESRVIGSLSNPHIIKAYDYGQEGDVVYLVMDLLRGGSLADLISQAPLSVETTNKVLDHIASALDYAHKKGIIHRDLKPPNVLLDEDGNAYLADFRGCQSTI